MTFPLFFFLEGVWLIIYPVEGGRNEGRSEKGEGREKVEVAIGHQCVTYSHKHSTQVKVLMTQ